ncbi:MAG: PepSY-associated TM helix domain-containing protein [Cellvibrio sp.]|uniref:PepSY-associated TM helix domain-containing protein n=1 Tax=Cellvibrio sp. TaxID=1965322 RepID=UPI0031ABD341
MKVRSDILRVYRSLHTWVGISAGLLLFIGFFAGALTMFKQPLDRWTSAPQQRLAFVDEAERDLLVSQLLEKHPAARGEFTLYLQPQENISAPVVWSEAEGGRELAISSPRWQATLDANGQLQSEQIMPSLLGDLVDMLHRTGGIPGFLTDEYLGVYVLGVAGVMYFLALVSGLILLLPTLVKDFFALRPGKNRKRFWLDAHNIIGITSLPFHIVISLTVIVFAFHDQFYDGLAEVVYKEQPMFTPPAAPSESYVLAEMLPPSELIKRLQAEAPEYQVSDLLYMRLETPRPMVRATIVNTAQMVHGPIGGYLGINPYTGAITNTSMLPEKADIWSALASSFFALHFGSYGGDLVRWVYFLLGLSGAFLFYSGNLLWVESRRKHQRGQQLVTQARNIHWMAAATVGVCLGSILGVAIAMIGGKWLYAHVDNINHGYLWIYYGVFLSAVAWAFWQGAARGAVHLLLACAVASSAIPLTSLIAILFPSSGLWAYTSTASLAVDATALVFALVFLWLAKLTWRRAHKGAGDSVWAVNAEVKDHPETISAISPVPKSLDDALSD